MIASQSVNYLERFIVDEGHTAHRFGEDYGYDVAMVTFDANGYVEPAVVYFQLKASENWTAANRGIAFDLDMRDYNLWRVEPMPVILVLYDAGKRHAFWLHMRPYLREHVVPRKAARTVRVWVPEAQRVNRRAVRELQSIKQRLLGH